VLSFLACEDEEPQGNNPPMEEANETLESFTINQLSGKSQKGPYLIGSSLILFELDEDFNQTGNSFAFEINDNLGSFDISGLELESPFAELRASGFYYNEVLNDNSNAQLSLSAIVDLSDLETVNLNVLTTLERNRVRHLVGEGISFTDAKAQAQNELLSFFELDSEEISNAEELDISQIGSTNAALLGISLMLQGANPVADLSQLINTISNDLENDGLIDNAEICAVVKSKASLLNLAEIRLNLETWFVELNEEVVIPDFESIVLNFLEESPCSISSGIVFPETGQNGLNVLHPSNTDFASGDVSMNAILQEGNSLRVRIYGAAWAWAPASLNGWVNSESGMSPNFFREFSNTEIGEIDLNMSIVQPFASSASYHPNDKITIEVYENGSDSPSWTKTLNLTEVESPFVFPPSGFLGQSIENLLQQSVGINADFLGSPYGLSAYIPDGHSIRVELEPEIFSLVQSTISGWNITQNNSDLIVLEVNGPIPVFAQLDLLVPCSPTQINNPVVAIFLDGSTAPTFSHNYQQTSFEVIYNGIFEGLADIELSSSFESIQIDGNIPLSFKLIGPPIWTVSFYDSTGFIYEDYDANTMSQTFSLEEPNFGVFYSGFLGVIFELDDNSGQVIGVEIYEGCAATNTPTHSFNLTLP